MDLVILNADNSDSNDVEIIKCKEINDCFVANNSYKNLFDKEISLKELCKYPLILPAKGSNTRNFLDEFAREKGMVLKPSIELASYSLVQEFAKAGFGIGYVVKDFIKSDINNKKIFEVKIKEQIPGRYIGIALSKNHLPNFSTKKLIQIITNSTI